MCRKFPFITLALNFLCFFGETLHASMPKKVVEIEMIKFQTIREVVRLFGTVKAKRQSAIISRIDGILEDALDSGSLVKKGQIVVRLSNKPSRAALETARQTEALEAEKYQRAKDLHHTVDWNHYLTRASLQLIWLGCTVCFEFRRLSEWRTIIGS